MNNSNNIKTISAFIALLGCITSGSVMAQSTGYGSSDKDNYNPSWYVAPSLNLMAPEDKFGTSHHGGGAGLRFGKPISPSWDIQFGTVYSRTHSGSASLRQNTLGIDALYLFSRSRLRPFVFIGGGGEYDRARGENANASHTSPFADAGVGIQYSFSEQWGVQADVRHVETFMHGNDFDFNRAHSNLATLGLIYVFNKPAPRAQRVEPVPEPVAVAQPAPTPPPPPPPAPAPRFEHYTLSSTELFAFDRSDLRPEQPKLDEIAGVLSRNTAVVNVNIIGYTDRIGATKYNDKLSQRRADAVKDYLIQKGIAPGRLTSTGKGEANPVVECSNKKRADLIKCLEPNRRVEVEQIDIDRRVN